MLDNTLARLVFVRFFIFLSRFAPFVEATLIICLVAYLRLSSPSLPNAAAVRQRVAYTAAALVLLLVTELSYAVFIFLPHTRRLRRSEAYPAAPLTREARTALFHRCLEHIPDPERYLRLCFLDADPAEIKRDNLRQFFLWAFFDRGDDSDSDSHRNNNNNKTDTTRRGKVGGGGDGRGSFFLASPVARGGHDRVPSSPGEQEKAIQVVDDDDHVDEAEMESYLAAFERRLGRKLAPGRGSAVAFRLSIDPIETRYRSVLLYGMACLFDAANHLILSVHGFEHHSPAAPVGPAAFPPQIPALLSSPRRSPSAHVGYWFRPHTSRTRRPVVFLHGVGIGLLPYAPFLTEIGQGRRRGSGYGGGEKDSLKNDDDGQVGILAIELLPISSRLTAPLPHNDQLVADIAAILAEHGGGGWDEFVLVSHSYGSLVTTHMLRSAALGARVRGVVLIDPVSVLLHMPDVGYNFMRRPPQGAHGWQLWYLARTDPGVAQGLGRNLCWRDSIIWREELLGLEATAAAAAADKNASTRQRRRRVAVCLTGKDLIIESRSVARYLAGEGAETAGATMTKRQKFVTPLEEMLEDQPTDTRLTQRSYVCRSGIELLWSPQLDHAQGFERRETRRHMIGMVDRLCTRG